VPHISILRCGLAASVSIGPAPDWARNYRLQGIMRAVLSRKQFSEETTMKKTFLAAAVILFASASAYAQRSCTSTVNGNTTYTNCSDGTSYTSQRNGNTTYTNGSDGSSSTSQQNGNTTYTNNSDGTSSTSQHNGSTTYTNNSDGTSSTTQHNGNNSYTNRSDGSSTTCQKNGNTTYCNPE